MEEKSIFQKIRERVAADAAAKQKQKEAFERRLNDFNKRTGIDLSHLKSGFERRIDASSSRK